MCCKGIKINGKSVRDDRAGVMTGDTLQIEGKNYLFYLKKEKQLSYQLSETLPDQKMIISHEVYRGTTRVVLINGTRKTYTEKVDLKPGTIWTPEGVLDPIRITRYIKLTGKDKFKVVEVALASCDQNETLELKRTIDDPSPLKISWEDLSQRKYLLIV